jgi:hypothetical protein
MSHLHRRFVLFALVALCASLGRAESPLEDRIDQAIRKALPEYDKVAAPIADDAEFLRRVYLDVTGVTPTSAEARAFLADKAADRRVRLVDRLLGSYDYSKHLAYQFDDLFLDRRPGAKVSKPDWLEYLRSSFAANKPYDELVREILSADGADAKTRSRARFYLERAADINQITKDISRVFLGMNLGCAQCHDHPVVDAFKQDYYYGIYAFLNRSYLFTDKASKLTIFAEKGDGDVSFESVFVPKVVRKIGMRLPGDTKDLMEPKLEKGKEYVKAVKAGERGEPTFSRRAQLPKQITESRQFARATANRLWSFYFGRGIVHPIEYDHPGNPPSHPELLDMLTDELLALKFDLKKFIRGIVLSKTYQRSSASRNDGKTPDAKWFAVAQLRPLTPEQFGWSMAQATGQLEAERAAQGKKGDEKTIYAKYTAAVDGIGKLFGANEGEPSVNQDFEATLDQTLFLSNGGLVSGWIAPRAGALTDRLIKLKDDKAVAEELYLSLLTRLPTAEDVQETTDYLKRSPDRTKAMQDLVWALLTSAEFRFNH